MTAALLLCTPLLAATPVEPIAQWHGLIADSKLEKHIPAEGYLSDTEALAEVWKAWRPDDKVPVIDFAKDLIVVAGATGQNSVLILATLGEKGNVKINVGSMRRDGPGFGYGIFQIPRDGVKTVNGKPLR